MSSFRLLLSIACLLGLSCTTYAQNLTASTPPANLTVIIQANNNFTTMALPSFPCSANSGLVGGYSTLDLDNAQNDDDLYYLTSEVFNYFSASTFNLTDCTFVAVDYLNVTNACSQVVSGTNYGLEFTVQYECIEEDVGFYSITVAPLRSTVYVPLADAALDTANEVINGPVIKDIWFYETPEVIATSEATPEEASPEEASAAEASSPEASPEISSNATTTNLLLTPSSGLGSTTSQLEFSSPAANTSSPTSSPQAGSNYPEPEVVSGFDVASQNQSIIAG